MAQKVHIVLEDDLDGSDASQTVSFGLDGATYEIDLNDKNAAALRDALAKYVGHGRKVGDRVATLQRVRERNRIGDLTDHRGNVLMLRPGRGPEIVDDRLVAVVSQLVNHVRADEPGSTGD